jgi:nuclease S1
MRRWIGPVAFVGSAIAALLLPAQASFAWGPEGHRIIALIADQLLRKSDPAVHAKVLAILATDTDERVARHDIASEATWADVLREKSPEARTATTAWHSVRLRAGSPDLAAACFGYQPLPASYPASHGPQNDCSVDKVGQFAAELKDPQTSAPERLAALQFLLNLTGELHDPLLAIDHGDRDGDCTALQIGAKPPVRLNAYWQETLVREVAGSDPAAAAARIAAAIPAAEAHRWAEGNPESWASQSFEVAKTVTYGFAAEKPAGKYVFPPSKEQKEACTAISLYRVGPEYATKALAAVQTQFARAGVRLAHLLRDSLK